MRRKDLDFTLRWNQVDLISTIGESAAVGASGSVLWGTDYDNQRSPTCRPISTLSPNITSVTAAAQLCSHFLCRRNGRCVHKNYDSHHYLHLNPELQPRAHTDALRGAGEAVAGGAAGLEEKLWLLHWPELLPPPPSESC